MLKGSYKLTLGLIGVLVLLFAAPWPINAADTASSAKEREWEVPVRSDASLMKVWAASDGKRAFVSEQFSEPVGDEGRRKYYTHLHMLETAGGKWVNLTQSLAKAVKAADPLYPVQIPSPDGKHVLFIGSGGRKSRLSPAWLFDIDGGKARKVAEGMEIFAVWGGTRLFVSCVSGKRQVGPVRIFDTAGGKPVSLGVCGIVAGSDPKGRLMACTYNPKKPARPLGMFGIRTAQLGLLRLDGKPHADISPLGKRHTMPVLISPGSKYLAVWRPDMRAIFRMPGTGNANRKPKSSILVMKIGDKKARAISGADVPLFVGDTGEVVAGVAGGDPSSKTIRFWDAKGDARTLAEGVRAASVSGGSLFHIIGPDKPKLRAMPIKAGK